jgi:tRNA G18 (ribose-2'-O)-methylase SpoU
MLRELELVTDRDDPRIDDYRNLRDRSLEERDRFVAESEVVLRVLLGRRTHPIRSVLLAQRRVEKLKPLLATLPESAPVLVAAQPVLDAITGFHIHRGVLASAERTRVPSARELVASLPPGPATVVATEGLTNHDNVGSVFRNAAALGADAIFLDAATCDPLYRKAIRVSVGACLIVPYGRTDSLGELIRELHRAAFTVIALTPNEPARAIESYRGTPPRRIALLLGSEGPGLCEATLALADERVRIRQRTSFDSLNVATACGIALHELAQAAR